MKKYLLILLVALAGCSSNIVRPYDPQHSEAYNVARADGLTQGYSDQLKDVPYSKIEESAKNVGPNNTGTALGLAVAAGDFSNLSSPPPGISGAMSGAFFLLGALLNVQTAADVPALNYQILAWMPTDFVKDKKHINRQWRKILSLAMKKSLIDLGYSYTKEKVKSNGHIYQQTVIGKNECSQKNLQASIDKNNEKHNTYKCLLIISFNNGKWSISPKEPELVNSPPWLTSKQAYEYSTGLYEAKAYIGDYVEVKEADNSYESRDFTPNKYQDKIYIRLAHYLPKWAYVYLPPRKGRNYPVIYNQDRALYFIQPKPGEKNRKQK